MIDDVHACLDTITTQFSIHIPADNELYSKMLEIFGQEWKSYNDKAYTDIVEMHDPQKIDIIPFWIWQEKQQYIACLGNMKMIKINLYILISLLLTIVCHRVTV